MIYHAPLDINLVQSGSCKDCTRALAALDCESLLGWQTEEVGDRQSLYSGYSTINPSMNPSVRSVDIC